jgi:sugar/nucleoside kinase (ribokinase family)
LARLGVDANCQSRVGDDEEGRWILEELKKEKVNLEKMQIDTKTKTDLSLILVEEKTGERIILANRDANEKLEVQLNLENSKNKIHSEMNLKENWIFLGSLYGNWIKKARQILEQIKKNNYFLAYNPGQNNLKENLKVALEIIQAAFILILNKDEALEIIDFVLKNSNQSNSNSRKQEQKTEKIKDEVFLLQNLQKLGPKIIALTDGVRGAWAIDNQTIYQAPALKAEKFLDATGAGDAFSSAFLAAYCLEKDIKKSLKWGIVNGKNVGSFFGAKDGLLLIQEIKKQAKKVKVNQRELN